MKIRKKIKGQGPTTNIKHQQVALLLLFKTHLILHHSFPFFSLSLSLTPQATYNELLHRRFRSLHHPTPLQNGSSNHRPQMDLLLDLTLPIQIHILHSSDLFPNHQGEPLRDDVPRRGGAVSGIDQRHLRGVPRGSGGRRRGQRAQKL